jgi:hypothetical protein
MRTIELVACALGAALSAALVVVLLAGAAFGYRMFEWTHSQSAAVGVAATAAGVVTANAFLAKLTRVK